MWPSKHYAVSACPDGLCVDTGGEHATSGRTRRDSHSTATACVCLEVGSSSQVRPRSNHGPEPIGFIGQLVPPKRGGGHTEPASPPCRAVTPRCCRVIAPRACSLSSAAGGPPACRCGPISPVCSAVLTKGLSPPSGGVPRRATARARVRGDRARRYHRGRDAAHRLRVGRGDRSPGHRRALPRHPRPGTGQPPGAPRASPG